MATQKPPVALHALEAPFRVPHSTYPEPFYSQMTGRDKHVLGDLFGLTNFGVNITRIRPGGVSALRHHHDLQDEFIYVVSGTAILVNDQGEHTLSPGMCAGFKAGSGDGHQLINRSSAEVIYLEIGDRTAGDVAEYPDDDIRAIDQDGHRVFIRKDGTPY